MTRRQIEVRKLQKEDIKSTPTIRTKTMEHHRQGFEIHGSAAPRKKITAGRKKLEEYLILKKRKEGTQNADFVP